MPRARRRSWSKASSTRSNWFMTCTGGSGAEDAVVGAVPVEVEQVHGQLDAAHAVGDGVVQLEDERRATLVEALHRRRPPTGAGPGRSPAWRWARPGRARRAASYRRPAGASGRGSRDRSWDRPPTGAGRSTSGWTAPVAAGGDHAGGAVDGLAEAVAIEGPVEDGDRGDRGPQQRVLLDGPHEGIGIAHAVVEVDLGHGERIVRA